MSKFHKTKDLRIIPEDTANAMLAAKPTYEIGDCQSELNTIFEAERKMSNIDGDFSITDWYDELESDKRLKITEESPIFLLMHARNCGNLQIINMGVEVSDFAIQSMKEKVDNPIQMLLDSDLIEKVYPEDTELPVKLYELYQEMSIPHPTPKPPSGRPHFMQMLFADHFSNNLWEENFDNVMLSLPHDNELKTRFENQKETIINFIKLINDYENILTTIYKNQEDNG